MDRPAYGNNDPIAAYATPLGESALAVIRITGDCSIDLCSRIFSRPAKLQESPGNTLVHGWIIREDGERIDEVMISVFRAPRSYTGEEGLDISCHGGIAAAKAVMRRLRTAGFRDALPGEFSFRAFMNGKLDLTRAESVMELVSAKTDLSRQHAVSRLSGDLERDIRSVKDLLVKTLAATELFLDYSEDDGVSMIAGGSPDTGFIEDDEAAGRMPEQQAAETALERLKALSASYTMETLYRDGALVVIAGPPNAGKSSLFNRLLKEDRSIVTDIPGTTRDWIEAWISVEGIPVRIVDTAGFQESEDPVELLGIERSRNLLAEADLILYLIDGTRGLTDDDRDFFRNTPGGGENSDPPETAPGILLWNKADQTPLPEGLAGTGAAAVLGISAKTGDNIQELNSAIARLLESRFGGTGEAPAAGIATERQKTLVDSAAASVAEALELARGEAPLDIIAPMLREAVNALGEITGDVSTADILETMFSRFCVGK
ncbi:tRNA uridine-5-carboxymethylaminomethyl(34) synthesis GTPase MnmE [Breznakiella homolactica]|uniref:tRNA modification GTPase MnmE n=1 Tax=Breznakiella homolactica TaxID=2798577 RepID=A0A7T7XMX2_9SPIR|nr:tRNA uridine-5-carboxymethylaminomethyl(34) synthesis GTPase MnmE [Breznakiella homolactica]QQO09251.1 tRNA uridine-5-carboxymethylaminomethyl(34) synthesis GTPase MnmE [Breznakiella homolactica]